MHPHQLDQFLAHVKQKANQHDKADCRTWFLIFYYISRSHEARMYAHSVYYVIHVSACLQTLTLNPFLITGAKS